MDNSRTHREGVGNPQVKLSDEEQARLSCAYQWGLNPEPFFFFFEIPGVSNKG
jgi:hypothetical protein